MRAVVQRARGAEVRVDGRRVGGFEGAGLVVLVGVTHDDTSDLAHSLADKVYDLRVFDSVRAGDAPDAPRELSASDLGLPLLVVSQFTLYADTRRGRRPTWADRPSSGTNPDDRDRHWQADGEGTDQGQGQFR